MSQPLGDRLPAVQVLSLYVAAIAGAEVVLVFASVLLGVLLHAMILAALLVHQGIEGDGQDAMAIAPLALVPMLRILSLTMPVPELPPTMWLVLITLPLLAATYGIARQLGLRTSRPLWGKLDFWYAQAAIAASGLVIAGIVVALGGVPLGNRELPITELLAAAVVVFGFVGFAEEALFRGVIQPAMTRHLHPAIAIALTAVLFCAAHLGTLSLTETVLAGCLGIWLGFCAHKGRSIIGPSVAHGLIAVAVSVGSGDLTVTSEGPSQPVRADRGAVASSAGTVVETGPRWLVRPTR